MKKELFRFALIRRLQEIDKSQTWLAKMLGVDKATISHYVTGDRWPRVDIFLRICDVLNIDPKEVRFN